MRRLVSAGGWQSLIRATDRVDIVRGPASPIHGPGSISGYINLVPKTARADEDRFIEAPRGDVAVTVASWDRHAIEGQRGGPARLFGKPAGYHVFGLWENAGSYYREHPGQRQLMLQGTLVVDLRGDGLDRGGAAVPELARCGERRLEPRRSEADRRGPVPVRRAAGES